MKVNPFLRIVLNNNSENACLKYKMRGSISIKKNIRSPSLNYPKTVNIWSLRCMKRKKKTY